MANYVGQFRTNYFKVKNEQKFRDWAGLWLTEAGLEVWPGKKKGTFALGAYDSIPSSRSLSQREKDTVRFKVGDEVVCKETIWCPIPQRPQEKIEKGTVLVIESIAKNGRVQFEEHAGTSGPFPAKNFEMSAEEPKEAEFAEELQGHLSKGEVAIILSCGSEKLRYLGGEAVVVPAMGKVLWKSMTTWAIDQATKLAGRPVSIPEY